MKTISFSWTVPALLAGHKTVTRREWKETWAKQFYAGEIVAAYDKATYLGGKQVATIELLQAPYQERTSQAPPGDYDREGLAWMEQQQLTIQGLSPRAFWDQWLAEDLPVWVVRFKVLEVANAKT